MKKPRGKADQEAWFRRFGADPKTGRIRGKILTGSCPVSIGLGLSLSLSCLSRMGEESELRERGSCRLASTRNDLLWNQDKEADLDPGYHRGDGFAGLPARYRRRTRTTRGRRVYIPRDMYRLFGLITGRITSPEFRFTSIHDGRRHGRIDERHGRTKRIEFDIVNDCAVDWPEWFAI